LKILIVVMIIILAALASMPGYAAALSPHENPSKPSQDFNSVALFWEYSWALDYVSSRDLTRLKMLQNEAFLANIPPDLKGTVQDFLAANQDLANLLSSIDVDLNTARALLSQFRQEDAMAILKAVEGKLPQAHASLGLVESKAQETGSWGQVTSAPAESEVSKAFDEVVSKLALQNKDLDSLAESVETLSKGAELRPTSVSLAVEPKMAFVGDKIGFQGRVTSDAEPLGGRRVAILLDGATAADIQTDLDGTYRGELVLPYRYVSEMSVEALYRPQGDDMGVYDGSASPAVAVTVLFYETRLSLETPKKAYPGRTVTLQGKFNYGNDPVPEARQVQVYWDDNPVTEEAVTEAFAIELPVPSDMSLGKHLVKVQVTPQQRYAPGLFTAELEVTKAAVFIEVDKPGMVLLPFGLTVAGKVYSDLGPLDGASVNIKLGGWEVTTRSANDGTFKVRLNTGMSLTMFGSHKLEVSAVPKEPWNRAGQVSPGLMVINLVNIIGLAFAIAVAFFIFYRVRRAFRRTPEVSLQPGPATPKTRYTAAPQPEAPVAPVSILLALYRQVLRLVQSITTMMLRPNQTLREFAQETAPRLGPLAGYFREFTLMIERALYSKHPTREGDVARGQELSKKLEEETRQQ